MNDVVIRPYQSRDREAVRQLCCDTADCGKPVENFFPDREMMADLVTRYYTDFEPECSWVAEHEGGVIGYVTGSVRGSRYQGVSLWRIAPPALLRAVPRGTLCRRQSWRTLWAALKTVLRRGFSQAVPRDYRGAHLHINLREGYRGQKLGRGLLEKFFTQAKAAGAVGLHAGVRGDNERACGFFERMGFVELSRSPVILPNQDGDYKSTYVVVYGRKL